MNSCYSSANVPHEGRSNAESSAGVPNEGGLAKLRSSGSPVFTFTPYNDEQIEMRKNMILQNLVFPKEKICQETELYIHTQAGTLSAAEAGQYVLDAGCEVDFLTYFNSFSAGKWRKYTTVHEVACTFKYQGDCEISLWEAVWDGDGINKRSLNTIKVETWDGSPESQKECRITFSCDKAEGIVYASMEAVSHVVVYSGTYETISETVKNPVELAVGICTYRREAYVTETIAALKQNFIDNDRSPLQGHLHIYVADNGQTLPREELSGAYIQVMKNKNAGGAGGFGRCMLEAVKAQKEKELTHILLMDDDIVLEPESIYRTYTLLVMLRASLRHAMLGGGLLRLDAPSIQHANGEMWNGGALGFTKQGYDLRQRENVVRNEEDLPVEYNGWWYCCFPLSDGFRGFPLPIFIHRDDIEYGLRFGGKIMTMNGIGVWHSAFENRRTSPMEYYDMRNALITCAIHNPKHSCLHMAKWMWRHMLGQMFRFRTEDQMLTLRAIKDFCQGVKFLKETDPCELHAELLKMGYTLQDMTDELKQLGVDPKDKKTPDAFYEEECFKTKHLLSINGWLLPGRDETVAMPMGKHPDNLYRCKRALLYDPETGNGMYVTRKRKDLIITGWRLLKAGFLLARKYRKAVRDFQKHGKELIRQDFWEAYTGGESTPGDA